MRDENQKAEQPKSPDRFIKAKVWGATGTAAVSGVFGIANVPRANAEITNDAGAHVTHVEKSKPKKLKEISQLPGFGEGVTEAQQEQLRQATVTIMIRPKGSDGRWEELCNAVKIAAPDPSTAELTDGLALPAHCAGKITGNDNGANKAGQGFFGAVEGPAIDLMNPITFPYDIAAFDSQQPLDQRLQNPLPLSSWVISLQEKDFSIAFPDLTAQDSESPALQWWNNIQALPAEQDAEKSEMIPGMAVGITGVPDNPNPNLSVLSTVGTYIGTYNLLNVMGSGESHHSDGSTSLGYVVVIKAPSPDKDACEWGASGSGAVTAKGRYLYTLIRRISLGYGKHHKIFYPDQNLKGAEAAVEDIEQQTGVKINYTQENTICVYSAPTPKDYGNLMRARGKFVTQASPVPSAPVKPS